MKMLARTTTSSEGTGRTAARGAGSGRLALALGGGAARGLAHIGVLEVFERAGITPAFIAGSSMGGLVGALAAVGLRAREIVDVARSFHFPRWFLPGGLLRWESLFEAAAPVLSRDFETLATPLAVTAIDLEGGTPVVLHSGPLLPAVRATCAVPGLVAPERLGGRWLIDGGLVNPLPVDVAWLASPDVVVAVKVGAPRSRRVPELDWRVTRLLSRLGRIFPNPATAKVSFEVVVRACEIVLDRQATLAAAMAGPEILVEPELGDIGLRDFERLDEAVAAGRTAAEAALPGLLRLLDAPPAAGGPPRREVTLRFDPVCAMAVSASRARARLTHEGIVYYFCSANCRDGFAREPEYYLRRAAFDDAGLAREEACRAGAASAALAARPGSESKP